MEVRFVLPDLEHLDEIECEAIAIPFFEDERPLRGVLGLLDWRLCGFLSRMLVNAQLEGSLGEVVLVPGRPHVSVDKLFLFGMGPGTELSEELAAEITGRMLRTLALAAVRTSAMVLPGRDDEVIAPARAMEIFLQVAARQPEHHEVIVVESAAGQKAMVPVLDSERRRARARSD